MHLVLQSTKSKYAAFVTLHYLLLCADRRVLAYQLSAHSLPTGQCIHSHPERPAEPEAPLQHLRHAHIFHPSSEPLGWLPPTTI
jgi:hypothetical protein